MTEGFSIRSFGASNAVESIEFQMPGQSTDVLVKGRKGEEEDDQSWMDNYGATDTNIAPSKKTCGGCGANFHCQDTALPGFLPVEMFEKLEKQRKAPDDTMCRRCYMLKKYNFLLNVNVCPVDYRTMMERLKLVDEILVVLVVDMTDLPGSIHKQLPDIIGRRKPMIVVGNKSDLLPPDQRAGYLKNFKHVLIQELRNAGFYDDFNVLHTALVSAKTGFGIENLVTQIFQKWSNQRDKLRNDFYLIGCTNAGKSTLFNTLLQSDLCKVRAVDLVERATSSIWPGTTISLLKFPVMNPNPYKMELRRRRLLSQQTWIAKERETHRIMLNKTNDNKYATLQANVGNTFREIEDDLQPMSNRELNASIYGGEEMKPKSARKWSLDDHIFTKGNWCFDTPGTVNEDQVLSMFTLEELVNVIPRQMMIPRTFITYPGQSALLGGVGRLDIEGNPENRTPVFLTVFASERLPVNVMATTEVEAFLKRYLGTATLVAPIGDADRLKQFGELQGKSFAVTSKGKDRSGADIVLSSMGWIAVTSESDTICKAFTAGGRGLYARESLLPYAVNLRGARIGGTAAYQVKPVKIPEPEKKKKFKKKRKH
ncbi:hypothetical protein L596_020546 [Steinernema carpocapsae]|uniref:G domain-containing protein n=1 Tax=Steinernema carpocapsae TaxID=34508 RepID=A0A4U5MTV7_STECR|nr:hypothetical protein L596_020546 [Steinernema carpocapsae]